MLVGVELVGQIQLRITKQIQVLASALVALQALQDGAGGMALVDEQRHRRHADLVTLGLAGPVQERLGQALEAGGAFARGAKQLAAPQPALRLGEHLLLALLGGSGDQRQQPVGKVALGALVPAQLRCQTRVVTVALG